MARVLKMGPVADSSVSMDNTLDWTQTIWLFDSGWNLCEVIVCGFMQSGWVGRSRSRHPMPPSFPDSTAIMVAWGRPPMTVAIHMPAHGNEFTGQKSHLTGTATYNDGEGWKCSLSTLPELQLTDNVIEFRFTSGLLFTWDLYWIWFRGFMLDLVQLV